MKEKKKIPLKRFPVLIGVCVLSLLLSNIGAATEETLLPDEKESVSANDPIMETPSVPATEPETTADPDSPSDPFPAQDVTLPEEELPGIPSTEPSFLEEEIATEPVPPSETDPEAETREETQKTPESESEETETETEPLSKRAAAGPFTLPYEQLSAFLVTWTNSGGEVVYSNDKGEIRGSLKDLAGTYTLKVEIACGEDCTALELGATYTLQLDWPVGDEVSVSLSEHRGDIVYTDKSNNREVYIGFWTLDEEGLLTLAIDDNEEAAVTNRWEGYFAVQAFVSSAFDVPLEDADIVKEGRYDPASQRITWTITTDIPAYAGNGKCSSWYVEDEAIVLNGCELNNDMADVRVSVSSGGASGEVPAVGEAYEGCPLAYALEDLGPSKERLYFLTPCTCTSENCQKYQDSCMNTVATGADGRVWCSCWDYRYNASFTVTYSVDVAQVLQELANYENLDLSKLVTNQAYLILNGKSYRAARAIITLKGVIGKKEIALPEKGNDYTATYRITVNPAGDDYGSAQYLTVTDSMTNLSLVAETLAVATGGGAPLELESDARIAALAREGNEDRYFSLEASKVEDGADNMPVQTLVIRIWYPTNQTYEITYDAMVVDPALGSDGSYGNQASLGGVTVSTQGRGYWAAGEWDGTSNAVTLEKIDAGERTKLLAGAEFEVWQYAPDGQDLLITTLTTGEDGRAVFQTNRKAGYFVKTNTLYYLKETMAPPGYLCGEDAIWFYLKEAQTAGIPDSEMPAELLDGSGSLREDANLFIAEIPQSGYADLVLEIENRKEAPNVVLPQTGGNGGIPGMAFALLLFFAAAVLLFSGRKNHLNNGEDFQ